MKKLLLSFVAFATGLTSIAQVSFYVNPPSMNSGNYSVMYEDATGLDWSMPDPADPANAVDDTLVIVQGVDSLGCDPLTNGTDINGQIAVVWRGDCQFGTKALNAQNAGAIAVVIVNNDGEPVGMAGGDDGLSVTIPVFMISTSTGELLYNEIMGGATVTAFIGNKFGYFANDIGINQKDVLRARQYATPIGLAQDNTEFEVNVGAWVYNYGVNTQANVTLNAKVTANASVLYDETSSAVATIPSGDSVWIALPTFSEATYSLGLYEMVYSVSSDSIDDFIDDNGLNADFLFTDNEYSYSRMDASNLEPSSNQFFQPSDFTSTFGDCIHFTDANASRKTATGLTFAATSATGTTLDGQVLSVEAYEWQDAVTDINDAGFGISLLNGVAIGEYTYATDDQGLAVSVLFDEQLALEDNAHYIFCVISSSQDVFLGYDNGLDYDENISGEDATGNVHGTGHVTSLVNNDGSYSGLGFGSDLSAALVVNMLTTAELGVDDNEVELEKAYPNPAVNTLTIPLNGVDGAGTLNIVDLSGKLISTQQVNLSASKLLVDVSTIANGMYVFNLKLENGKSSTFNVVVGK
ncbi:hypothetical protein DNU06_03695 [Putridiphycobacter roseus]|uniref:PA domain-containing protein n=1 Tax=Putridiphycobacter roseus TaxID=2219161 RepID=A0A2W1N553_9FLAO|nr:PA domain-containing protein [Putridiphycobacter roseus]PZE18944.1 hypothetical protein DNU06_03695 [Putridiphycobacter roseus]